MKGVIDAILHREQAEYLERLVPERDEVARALEADADLNNVPIVDPEVGRFLHIAALSINARRVLEVGTATGYSGLHLLRALPVGGELVTIDISADRQRIARDHWREAGVADRATFLLGPALEIIPSATGPFDLLFIDAIKTEYQGYLDLALPKLRLGGIVIADNVLWKGRVALGDRDADSDALRDFNAYAIGHPQLTATVLPVGDGLLYGVKTAD